MNVPSVPMGLYAVKPTNVNEIRIGWLANPESNVTNYDLYRAFSSMGSYKKIASISASMVYYLDVLATQHLRTDYYYKLKAVNPFGESDFTDPVTYIVTARDDPMWIALRNILLTIQGYPTQQIDKMDEIKSELISAKNSNRLGLEKVESAVYALEPEVAGISVVHEVPGGAKNGVNQLYFSRWPFIAGSLDIEYNGESMRSGEDFIIKDKNSFKFMLIKPIFTDTIYISYRKAADLSEAVKLVE